MSDGALESITEDIIDRIQTSVGNVAFTAEVSRHSCLAKDPLLLKRVWVSMTSSRLGDDPNLHRDICRFLSRCLLDCRVRDALVVVAIGSAIEPWAIRAAELFDVPVVRVQVRSASDVKKRPADNADVDVQIDLSRDDFIAQLGDRVDAVYVRSGGKVACSLQKRVQFRHDASTRVAITGLPKCAGKDLVAQGAVGWLDTAWFGHRDAITARAVTGKASQKVTPNAAISWIHHDDEWLVHCTRGCRGPWPGQTDHQYQDAILLGTDEPTRQPIDSLKRILRSGRLIASAIASAKAWPVVCFSAAPLADLLLSRCYRPHLRRWDYEPYGVAIRRHVAQRYGIQPVIYDEASRRELVKTDDQYRFQAAGNTFDWTTEREWRCPTDVLLDQLNPGDVRIFVATQADIRSITGLCDWPVDAVLEPARNDTDPV